MKIIGVIPARMESSRFPGKPLADIDAERLEKKNPRNSKINAPVITTSHMLCHVVRISHEAK